MWYVLWWFHSSDTAWSDTLLSIVLCTVLPLSSQRNWKSLCMTQHYILQGERRWKKMKWDSSGTSTKNTASSMLVALPKSEMDSEPWTFSLSVWHSTLQGYWLHCAFLSLPEHQLGVSETRKARVHFYLCNLSESYNCLAVWHSSTESHSYVSPQLSTTLLSHFSFICVLTYLSLSLILTIFSAGLTM